MVYILAQFLGFIAFLISIISYHRNKKNGILGGMILSNILNLTHYFLLGAYSGCFTKFVAIFRDFFIILKSKNKVLSSSFVLMIFVIIYVIMGVLTYDGVFSIFPILAAIIYLIPVWYGNCNIIRKTAFIGYFLWLIYNIFIFSMAGIIANVVSIVSILIAIKKYGRS